MTDRPEHRGASGITRMVCSAMGVTLAVCVLASWALAAHAIIDPGNLAPGMIRLLHSPIPLQLWQTYPNILTDSASDHRRTWRDLNPALEMHLHNDTQGEQLIKAWFSDDVVKIYQGFPLNVMRADFWRYAAVFATGGFYADLDTRCLKPIADWLNSHPLDTIVRQQEEMYWRHCRMVVALENHEHFCQWTFGACHAHPVLGRVLDNIIAAAKKGINFENPHFVHAHTGPGIFTHSILEMLGLPVQTNASDAYHMVYSNQTVRQRAHELGLCIFAEDMFRNRTVTNTYASQKGHGNWSFKSWHETAVEIWEKVTGGHYDPDAKVKFMFRPPNPPPAPATLSPAPAPAPDAAAVAGPGGITATARTAQRRAFDRRLLRALPYVMQYMRTGKGPHPYTRGDQKQTESQVVKTDKKSKVDGTEGYAGYDDK